MDEPCRLLLAGLTGDNDSQTSSGAARPAERAARSVAEAVHAAGHSASRASGHMRQRLGDLGSSLSPGSTRAAESLRHAASDLRRAVGSSIAEAAAGFAEAVGGTSHVAGRAGRAFGHAVAAPVHLARLHRSTPKVLFRPRSAGPVPARAYQLTCDAVNSGMFTLRGLSVQGNDLNYPQTESFSSPFAAVQVSCVWDYSWSGLLTTQPG